MLLPAEPRFVLLVAGAASVILVAALAIWSIVAGQGNDREAERASRIREQARRLVTDLYTVETSQRGFLLTDDASYLDGGDAARDDADHALDELQRSAPLELAPTVTMVAGAVHAKMVEMSASIALARAGQRGAALAAVRTGLGQRAMVRSLAGLDDIIAALSAVEVAQDRQRRAAARTTVTVIVVGSVVAVLALVVGITSLRRRTLERARAMAEVQQQSAENERRRVALSQALGQLAMVNQALAHSNRDLDQFAYVASHDLKAPLRGIASLATWIEEDLGDRLDDEIAQHLRLLRSRVERLELLIEGILAYSRAGRAGTPAAPVDIGAQLGKVIELLAPPEEVRIVVASDRWPTITTVAVQLEQVWMNLIGNAIKHGRRPTGEGHVQVRCLGCEAGSWHFCVEDDGPGIAPEFRDRIFGMFQRLQSRDEVEGAGIGLAVVRKLVTAHSGKVWAEAPPSGGTAMHFTWSAQP
ncbi:MAG TPA: ATP-binding protein [Kofleriaceae bacterium]|nr:ATP-binding protein [Kofleriaceae bacterium]